MTRWFRGFATVAMLEFKGGELGSIRRWISFMANPISYLCFLGAGLAAHLGGAQYLEFMLPGVIVIQAISSMSSVIYRVVLERRWGLAALKLQAGIPGTAYLAGLLSAPLCVFLGRVVVLVGLGCALSVRIGLGNLAVGVAVSLLAAVFWSLTGIVVAAVLKDYRTRDFVVGLLLMPLMFAAPTFYSLDSAPAFLRVIAQGNPLTYQVDAVRAAMAGRLDLTGLVVSVALIVVAATGSVLCVHKMRQVSFEA